MEGFDLPTINGWEQRVLSSLTSDHYRFRTRRNGGPYEAKIFFEERVHDQLVQVRARVYEIIAGERGRLIEGINDTFSGEGCKPRAAERVLSIESILDGKYFPPVQQQSS